MALVSEATEILFGGASEGGKSHLIRVALCLWCLAIPKLQCVLIRKKFDDIKKNHVEGPNGFRSLLAELVEVGFVSIVEKGIKFKNGSNIDFVHCFTADTVIETTKGKFAFKDLIDKRGYVSISASIKALFKNVHKTRNSAPVLKVTFEDGYTCRCTPDHKFITSEGAIQAADLKGKSCLTNRSKLSAQQFKNLRASSIKSTANTMGAILIDYIGKSGSITTAIFQAAMRFIIQTTTAITTRLKTLNCLQSQSIESCTPAQNLVSAKPELILVKGKMPLLNGMEAQMVYSGTKSNTSALKTDSTLSTLALAYIVSPLLRWGTLANTVQQNVGKQNTESQADTRLKRLARFVQSAILRTNIDQQQLVALDAAISYSLKKCVSVEPDGVEDVYCLTVPDYGYFPLGNGVLAFNCQDDRQFDSAQGIEKHVIVVDEATQISHILLTMFRGWCRMDKAMQATIPESVTFGDVTIPLKGRFPRIMYTGNPIGKSVGWFRRNFVIARPDFEIEEVHGFLRQYIPSKVTDNLSVDLAAHKGRLAAFDPALARALDEGDWNSPIGDFFRGYDESIHVIPDFRPPDYWFKYRTFDWGSAEPFCVQWHCVADGEEFKAINGTKLWAQAGTIITYREWYGCDKDDPAKGIGMRNEQIAKGILQRTTETMQFQPVVTDSLPFQDRGNAGDSGEKFTTADDFASFGVPLTRGNCARVFGWNQCTNRLIGTERGPLCMIAESCTYLREYIPTIERDTSNPEDCVSDGEATHSVDCWRYAQTSKPLTISKPAESTPLQNSDFDRRITPKEILKQLKRQRR